MPPPVTQADVAEAMRKALVQAGHTGSACGLVSFTATLGTAGSQVECGCGAIMWTRDLAALATLRDCPLGHHDGQVVRHRATTEADVVAWLKRVYYWATPRGEP